MKSQASRGDVVRWPPLPESDLPSDTEGCQALFLHLVRLLHPRSRLPLGAKSGDLIAEIFRTARCDAFLNMAPVRQEIAEHLGEERTVRIVEGVGVTDDDERRAWITMLNYRSWANDVLRTSLTWTQRLQLHFGDVPSFSGIVPPR